jgi:hypothetical protein
LPDAGSTKRSGLGGLITETSSETMKAIEADLRTGSMVWLLPAIALLAIGLLLWLWLDVAWWLYIVFLVVGGFLLFIGIMVLSLYVSVPKLEVYEGGVLVRPPRGRSVPHPWEDFRGYSRTVAHGMKVTQLHPVEGGDGPITIHEQVDRFDDVLELVAKNMEELD